MLHRNCKTIEDVLCPISNNLVKGKMLEKTCNSYAVAALPSTKIKTGSEYEETV